MTALALGLALAACDTDCREACENFARVCAAEFQASSLTFDLDACETSCEDNLPGCANAAERTACIAGASTCSAARECPACGER